MTKRYFDRLQIFTVVGGVSLLISWALFANDLEEALKGGDFGKVFNILGPGKVEEFSELANGVEVVEAPEEDKAPKSQQDRVIRAPANRSSAKPKSTASVRNKEVEAPSESMMAQAPLQETTRTPSASKNQSEGKPRKALTANQPAQVPMTRPRVSNVSANDLQTEKSPTNGVGKITFVEPSTMEPEPAVERHAPEDRNRASAELVALLKEMSKPSQPVEKGAAIGVSPAIPLASPDEDLDRSKPLAMPKKRSGDSTGTTLRARSLGGPTGTMQSATAKNGSERRPRDIIRNTRSDLEELMRVAKNEAFVGTAASEGSSSQLVGEIPARGWQYEGQWRNGRMDGYGILTYPDGWRYEGEWQNGKMIGQGTLTHPDGWQYKGTWRDGKMDGEGELTYPDGWKYVGQWREGKMHGTGDLVHPND